MNHISINDGVEPFDPAMSSVPYENDSQYLADLFTLLSLHLSAAVSLQQETEARHNDAGPIPAGIAVDLKSSQIQAQKYPFKPETRRLFLSQWEHVNSRIIASFSNSVFLRLEWLRVRFKLDDYSFFAVLCAFAAACDRSFETLFVSLHQESSLRFATVGAVQALFSLTQPCSLPDMSSMESLSNPYSPVSRLVFRPTDPSVPELLRPLELKPVITNFLKNQYFRDPKLLPWYRILPTAKKPPELLLRDTQLRCAAAALKKAEQGGCYLLILAGPEGSGRKLTLGAISHETDQDMILLRPAEVLARPDGPEELAEYLATTYLLEFAIPALELFEQPEAPVLRLLELLARDKVPAVLLTPPLRGGIVPEPYLVTRIDYPAPSLEESLAFWEIFSKRYPDAEELPWPELAAKYIISPGKIKKALQTARFFAETEGVKLDSRLIDRAVIQGNTDRLSEVADRINAFYSWDDLILGDASKDMLRCICDRIRLRHVVERDWGFGRRAAYGKGISMLLYGPPGTGKTMCAQVMANELNLPLYRINLAQIISKYIGETAKNLDTIFSQAKNSNVILFFDEADALFSKRTDVKSSNDRHANSESAYLLQKIEDYDGISILATNLVSNFDEAFRRRISYMINVHMPGAAERLKLWRQSFPPEAPVADDVDYQLLADNLEISGSIIKSASTQAAYFAAARGGDIRMADLIKAVRLELQKLGKSEPHFMGMYHA